MGRLVVPALLVLAGVFAAGCAEGAVDDLGPSEDALVGSQGPRVPRAADANRAGVAVALPSESATTPSQPANLGPLFRAAYDGSAATSLNTFYRDEAALQSDGTVTIATKKGRDGIDPQPTDYHGGSFYNGGTFRYASITSPVWNAAAPFDRVTPSIEASTPAGTWVEVFVTAHVAATGTWTKEYSLGVWAYDATTVRRHSVGDQKDAAGDVAFDTLALSAPADALQVTVVLFSEDATATPSVRAVTASTALSTSASAASKASGDRSAWGKTLAVPGRSQKTSPDADEGWSSPTSASMLLGYYGIDESPATAAALCNDVVQDGAGNRSFATAHTAALADGALHAMVTRLASFEQVEPLIAADVPVAISLAYDAGELTGAPLASTAGHLVVVKGFAANGDVVVNDPAFATDASVETTYDRAELAAAWRRSGGTAYVAWPSNVKLPADPLGAY